MERTRDEWQAFASEHDCCLEPVLELDEALDSELTRAREMVVSLDAARRGEGGAPARRAGEAVAARRARRRDPGRGWASTRARCWRALGYSAEEIAGLEESGAVAGPAEDTAGSFLS